METFIVYVDDAAYAKHLLAPLLDTSAPARWVLVACPPRMSRRIGKWLSHSARENWRAKWSDKLFARTAPMLSARSDQLECIVAKGPLPELTQQLQARLGVARVLDMRRPKFGQELAPVTHDQPIEKAGWQLPAAVGSLGAVLVLAGE
jgi:hypothetical protein